MTLRTATLLDYYLWVNDALKRKFYPTHYYDYAMPKMALADRDFTMNDECGAMAIDIIVLPGVRYHGPMGHNRLFLPGGKMDGMRSYGIYSNSEFMSLPGMWEFRQSELAERARRDAKWKAKMDWYDNQTSDIRSWRSDNR